MPRLGGGNRDRAGIDRRVALLPTTGSLSCGSVEPALAHPEQQFPQTLTFLVREALRAAALSDRPNDAIDILADALLALAVLAHPSPAALANDESRCIQGAEYSYSDTDVQHG